MKKRVRSQAFGLSRILTRGLMLLLLIFCAIQLWYFLQVCWFTYIDPASSAMMQNQQAIQVAKNPAFKIKHQWVAISKISPNLQRAVMTAEDAKFNTHNGFDWDGIKLAYKKNIKRGRIVAGGSTISQQLAKNLFLSASKTPWRKAQEAIITMMIELIMPKQRILELYLNLVEWGNGIFGAQAAAQHYFHRSAQYLSKYQSANLAAMLPNPRYYDKHRYTPFLHKKTARIVQQMHTVALPTPPSL